MKRLALSVAAALCVMGAAATCVAGLVDDLQAISVTIRAGHSQGSGVLFTREVEGQRVTFVWTAAHVVDGLRQQRKVIDPATGTERVVVEFSDAQVVQEFREGGRRVGESAMDAKVIRYSDAQTGEDLALLRIRKAGYSEQTAKFYLDAEIPAIGTELYHVGSLLGQIGANSLTSGIVSQHGRVLDFGARSVVFDQTTVTAFPGSSGGGVYLKGDGRYVGMLVRGAGEGFNLIVPVRRMREWSDKVGVQWAIDPALPAPTLAELDSIPAEDSGVEFTAGPMAGAKTE